jgi:prolyl oligopeptidase
MRRYTKFPPGPSWIEEYGDPDNPEDWAFLQEISAYHLASDAVTYPPVFIWTSAADDRTHPGHARKMGAKLQALGQRALLYEPKEGGHGFADLNQAAFGQALGFSFLRHTICGAR